MAKTKIVWNSRIGRYVKMKQVKSKKGKPMWRIIKNSKTKSGLNG